MTQPISRPHTTVQSNNLYANADTTFQLKALKPHLASLQKHVEQGDFRARVAAQLVPGTAVFPLWHGPAQIKIAPNTQAVVRTDVVNGRVTKLSIDLSKPVVLLNPVGSIVPDTIPGASLINSGTFSIEGMDMYPEGHIVPRGTIKMWFSVPIHQYIPLQFCPVINTDAMSFFHGKVIKSIGGKSSFHIRNTIAGLLKSVASYDIRSIFKPGRPIHHLNIQYVDASMQGTLLTSRAGDEFMTAPSDARIAVTINDMVHQATLVQPQVRLWTAGLAHMHSAVQLTRAIPYAPTPPRHVDLDVALDTEGKCELHAHSGGLLEDLEALDTSKQLS